MTQITSNSEFDIAVILINYNSSSFTIECVSSILQQTSTDISYGVVIIDNASEDEDYINLVNGLSQFDSK